MPRHANTPARRPAKAENSEDFLDNLSWSDTMLCQIRWRIEQE